MRQFIYFMIVSVFLIFSNPSFADDPFADEPKVPDDKYIIKTETNTMPRNVAIFYDTDLDGKYDIVFYFAIYEDGPTKVELKNVSCVIIPTPDAPGYFEKICRYDFESDLWVLSLEDSHLYRMMKDWSKYAVASNPNELRGIESTKHTIGNYDPEKDEQLDELMDFTEDGIK